MEPNAALSAPGQFQFRGSATPRVLGGRPRKPLLAKHVIFAIYFLVIAFYVAGIYLRPILFYMGLLKWTSLFVLVTVLSFYMTKVNGIAKGYRAFLPIWLLAFLLPATFFSMRISDSVIFYCGIILTVAASWMLAGHISGKRAQAVFFGIVANVGRFVIASSFFCYVLGINLGRAGGGRFSGWTDNPNTLGIMIAPTILILITQILDGKARWQIWSMPFIMMGLVLLVSTGSRASLLWVLSGCFIIYAFKQGIGLVSWLMLLAIAFIAIWWNQFESAVLGQLTRDNDNIYADVLSGRSELWPFGVEMFWEKPVLGHGLSMSPDMIDTIGQFLKQAQAQQFHNSYITVLVEAGAIGFIGVFVPILAALAGGLYRASTDVYVSGPNWATEALPWAIVFGAMWHGFFETWFISPGNANIMLFWTCVWLLACDPNAKRLYKNKSLRRGRNRQQRKFNSPEMVTR